MRKLKLIFVFYTLIFCVEAFSQSKKEIKAAKTARESISIVVDTVNYTVINTLRLSEEQANAIAVIELTDSKYFLDVQNILDALRVEFLKDEVVTKLDNTKYVHARNRTEQYKYGEIRSVWDKEFNIYQESYLLWTSYLSHVAKLKIGESTKEHFVSYYLTSYLAYKEMKSSATPYEFKNKFFNEENERLEKERLEKQLFNEDSCQAESVEIMDSSNVILLDSIVK